MHLQKKVIHGVCEMPILLRRKMLFVVVLIVLANCADLISTYLASPDLANEWNVLQRNFHLGWAGLIVAKAIGGLLAAAGYAYYLLQRDRCYPSPGATPPEFRRHFSFGRQVPANQMWSGIPFGRHLGVNLGYFWTGMQGLVLWVALDNMLLREGIVFPLRYWSEMAYHLLQSGVVAIVVLWRFYHGNYRRYSCLTAPTQSVMKDIKPRTSELPEALSNSAV
jgi:hypothetical protein